MSKIKHKKILNLILIFCIFALFTAFFIEYILGHQPCNLCLIERIPYIMVVIIILFCFFSKRFEKLFLIIISLIFFITMLISFYHFGIEQGFIAESLVCDLSEQNNTLNKDELLNQLQQNTISCKDVTFKIFGLSLATINIFVSLILSIISLRLFLNYEKN